MKKTNMIFEIPLNGSVNFIGYFSMYTSGITVETVLTENSELIRIAMTDEPVFVENSTQIWNVISGEQTLAGNSGTTLANNAKEALPHLGAMLLLFAHIHFALLLPLIISYPSCANGYLR